MDNLLWTDTAQESYEQTLDVIFKRWSLDVAFDWDEKVSKLLKNLNNHKNLCPPSNKYRGLRRCVITEYTSLLYRVKGDKVELITFFDNRSADSF